MVPSLSLSKTGQLSIGAGARSSSNAIKVASMHSHALDSCSTSIVATTLPPLPYHILFRSGHLTPYFPHLVKTYTRAISYERTWHTHNGVNCLFWHYQHKFWQTKYFFRIKLASHFSSLVTCYDTAIVLRIYDSRYEGFHWLTTCNLWKLCTVVGILTTSKVPPCATNSMYCTVWHL